MKHCPTCERTFADDELSFCLHDGTPLVRGNLGSSSEGQATRIFGAPPPTSAMPPPRPTEYAPGPSPAQPAAPQPYGWANESPAARIPPAPSPLGFSRAATNQQQTLAIVSLVFGLASITFGWICGGWIFGTLALVLGGLALMQINREPGRYGGKGLALGGMISGGVAFLIHLAIVAIWLVALIISAVSSR
jgi:hypothetical protein